MATNHITLDEGTTTNTGTYSGTEDAITKHIGRIVLNNSSLAEVGTSGNPLIVSPSATVAVYFDRGGPGVNANITGQNNTFNVQLDPGHTLGNIGTLGNITSSLAVFFDRGNPSVNIGTPTVSSITNSVAVYFDRGNPSVSIAGQSATLNVQLDPGHTLGSISNTGFNVNNSPTVTANAGSGTLTVAFDPGHTVGNIGTVNSISTTVNVQLDPGHTLGNINTVATVTTLTNTATVKFDPGYTLGKVDQGVASSTQAWLVNNQNTASIFTISGSASGVSTLGNTIISPSGSYNFKVFAYSIQTTGLVSLTTKFTNGAGSATEFWRPLITPASTTSIPVGANLMATPPGYIFATGTNTTLALVLDSASLVHYSVSYIKESA